MRPKRVKELDRLIAKLTAVVERHDTTPKQKAVALVSRGEAKALLNDLKGAVFDFNAVIKIRSTPPDIMASALYDRGLAKYNLNDQQGATIDFTAVIKMPIENRMFAASARPSGNVFFLYDVTSSYLEGVRNELAAFGYNRDGKKGKRQITIGLGSRKV